MSAAPRIEGPMAEMTPDQFETRLRGVAQRDREMRERLKTHFPPTDNADVSTLIEDREVLLLLRREMASLVRHSDAPTVSARDTCEEANCMEGIEGGQCPTSKARTILRATGDSRRAP